MKRCTVEDSAAVLSILIHPRVVDWITDDMSPDPQLLDYSAVLAMESAYVLLPCEGCLTIFFPVNGITWEVHSAALPDSRGKKMIFACRAAIAWMFGNTPCRKIITHVPTFNPLALRLAQKSGMHIEGCITKSFLKRGILYDQTILGISKKEESCQH